MPPSRNELQEVSSRVYPDLERVPGKQNWVDKTGGLPSYIERIAKHMHYERGRPIGQAIASAVATTKRWCSTGKNWNGGDLKPTTRAKACAAVASWEAKRAKSKAKTAAKSLKETAELQEAFDLTAADDLMEMHCDDKVAKEIGQLVKKRLIVAEGMLPLLREPKTVGKQEIVKKAIELMEADLSESVKIGRLGGPAAEPRDMKKVADLLADEVDELRALAESFGQLSEGDMAEDTPPWEKKNPKGKKGKKLTDKQKAAAKARAKKAGRKYPNLVDNMAAAQMQESLQRGAEGEAVAKLQAQLWIMEASVGDAGVDGVFGIHTERALKAIQRRIGLKADGVAGPKTQKKLNGKVSNDQLEESAGGSPALSSYAKWRNARMGPGGKIAYDKQGNPRGQVEDPEFEKKHPRGRGGRWITVGSKGAAVRGVQKDLGMQNASGKFDSATEAAVRQFQQMNNLQVDGIVGAQTAAAMQDKMGKPVGEMTKKDMNFLLDRAKRPAGRPLNMREAFVPDWENLREDAMSDAGDAEAATDGNAVAAPEGPPNLREARAGDMRCETCEYYENGKCTKHGDHSVGPNMLCDDWESEMSDMQEGMKVEVEVKIEKGGKGDYEKEGYEQEGKETCDCGKGDHAYCPNCGWSEGEKCSCGAELEGDEKYCPECGSPNNPIIALIEPPEMEEAKLSYKEKKALPESAFVFPSERKYPIHDEAHARNALARVAQFGTPEEKSKVRAAVKKRYPNIELQEASIDNRLRGAAMSGLRSIGGNRGGWSASRIASIKRLADGTFAPKGRGRVLRPGDSVDLAGTRGKIEPDGKSIRLANGRKLTLNRGAQGTASDAAKLAKMEQDERDMEAPGSKSSEFERGIGMASPNTQWTDGKDRQDDADLRPGSRTAPAQTAGPFEPTVSKSMSRDEFSKRFSTGRQMTQEQIDAMPDAYKKASGMASPAAVTELPDDLKVKYLGADYTPEGSITVEDGKVTGLELRGVKGVAKPVEDALIFGVNNNEFAARTMKAMADRIGAEYELYTDEKGMASPNTQQEIDAMRVADEPDASQFMNPSPDELEKMNDERYAKEVEDDAYDLAYDDGKDYDKLSDAEKQKYRDDAEERLRDQLVARLEAQAEGMASPAGDSPYSDAVKRLVDKGATQSDAQAAIDAAQNNAKEAARGIQYGDMDAANAALAKLPPADAFALREKIGDVTKDMTPEQRRNAVAELQDLYRGFGMQSGMASPSDYESAESVKAAIADSLSRNNSWTWTDADLEILRDAVPGFDALGTTRSPSPRWKPRDPSLKRNTTSYTPDEMVKILDALDPNAMDANYEGAIPDLRKEIFMTLDVADPDDPEGPTGMASPASPTGVEPGSTYERAWKAIGGNKGIDTADEAKLRDWLQRFDGLEPNDEFSDGVLVKDTPVDDLRAFAKDTLADFWYQQDPSNMASPVGPSSFDEEDRIVAEKEAQALADFEEQVFSLILDRQAGRLSQAEFDSQVDELKFETPGVGGDQGLRERQMDDAVKRQERFAASGMASPVYGFNQQNRAQLKAKYDGLDDATRSAIDEAAGTDELRRYAYGERIADAQETWKSRVAIPTDNVDNYTAELAKATEGIYGGEGDEFRGQFGMFSAEGDMAVKKFIDDLPPNTTSDELETGLEALPFSESSDTVVRDQAYDYALGTGKLDLVDYEKTAILPSDEEEARRAKAAASAAAMKATPTPAQPVPYDSDDFALLGKDADEANKYLGAALRQAAEKQGGISEDEIDPLLEDIKARYPDSAATDTEVGERVYKWAVDNNALKGGMASPAVSVLNDGWGKRGRNPEKAAEMLRSVGAEGSPFAAAFDMIGLDSSTADFVMKKIDELPEFGSTDEVLNILYDDAVVEGYGLDDGGDFPGSFEQQAEAMVNDQWWNHVVAAALEYAEAQGVISPRQVDDWFDRNWRGGMASPADLTPEQRRIVERRTSDLLPAGDYFVGDPAYAFDGDAWTEALDSSEGFDELNYGAKIMQGPAFTASGTAYGDGTYTGSDGKSYSVDAGLLGVVPAGEGQPTPRGMQRVTFDNSFSVEFDDDSGQVRIGNITIETDEDDDYDLYEEDDLYDDEPMMESPAGGPTKVEAMAEKFGGDSPEAGRALEVWAGTGWDIGRETPGSNYSATKKIDGGYVSVYPDGGAEVRDDEGYVVAFSNIALRDEPMQVQTEAEKALKGDFGGSVQFQSISGGMASPAGWGAPPREYKSLQGIYRARNTLNSLEPSAESVAQAKDELDAEIIPLKNVLMVSQTGGERFLGILSDLEALKTDPDITEEKVQRLVSEMTAAIDEVLAGDIPTGMASPAGGGRTKAAIIKRDADEYAKGFGGLANKSSGILIDNVRRKEGLTGDENEILRIARALKNQEQLNAKDRQLAAKLYFEAKQIAFKPISDRALRRTAGKRNKAVSQGLSGMQSPAWAQRQDLVGVSPIRSGSGRVRNLGAMNNEKLVAVAMQQANAQQIDQDGVTAIVQEIQRRQDLPEMDDKYLEKSEVVGNALYQLVTEQGAEPAGMASPNAMQSPNQIPYAQALRQGNLDRNGREVVGTVILNMLEQIDPDNPNEALDIGQKLQRGVVLDTARSETAADLLERAASVLSGDGMQSPISMAKVYAEGEAVSWSGNDGIVLSSRREMDGSRPIDYYDIQLTGTGQIIEVREDLLQSQGEARGMASPATPERPIGSTVLLPDGSTGTIKRYYDQPVDPDTSGGDLRQDVIGATQPATSKRVVVDTPTGEQDLPHWAVTGTGMASPAILPVSTKDIQGQVLNADSDVAESLGIQLLDGPQDEFDDTPMIITAGGKAFKIDVEIENIDEGWTSDLARFDALQAALGNLTPSATGDTYGDVDIDFGGDNDPAANPVWRSIGYGQAGDAEAGGTFTVEEWKPKGMESPFDYVIAAERDRARPADPATMQPGNEGAALEDITPVDSPNMPERAFPSQEILLSNGTTYTELPRSYLHRSIPTVHTTKNTIRPLTAEDLKRVENGQLDGVRVNQPVPVGMKSPAAIEHKARVKQVAEGRNVYMPHGTVIKSGEGQPTIAHGYSEGPVAAESLSPDRAAAVTVQVADALDSLASQDPEFLGTNYTEEVFAGFVNDKDVFSLADLTAVRPDELAGYEQGMASPVAASTVDLPANYSDNLDAVEMHQMPAGTLFADVGGYTYVLHRATNKEGKWYIAKPVDADGNIIQDDPHPDAEVGKPHSPTKRILHWRFAPRSTGGMHPDYAEEVDATFVPNTDEKAAELEAAGVEPNDATQQAVEGVKLGLDAYAAGSPIRSAKGNIRNVKAMKNEKFLPLYEEMQDFATIDPDGWERVNQEYGRRSALPESDPKYLPSQAPAAAPEAPAAAPAAPTPKEKVAKPNKKAVANWAQDGTTASPARSPKGNIRNIKAMNNDKLLGLINQMTDTNYEGQTFAAADPDAWAKITEVAESRGINLPEVDMPQYQPGAAPVAPPVADLPESEKGIYDAIKGNIGTEDAPTPETTPEPAPVPAVDEGMSPEDAAIAAGEVAFEQSAANVASELGGGWDGAQVIAALGDLAQKGVDIDVENESPQTVAAVLKATGAEPMASPAGEIGDGEGPVYDGGYSGFNKSVDPASIFTAGGIETFAGDSYRIPLYTAALTLDTALENDGQFINADAIKARMDETSKALDDNPRWSEASKTAIKANLRAAWDELRDYEVSNAAPVENITRARQNLDAAYREIGVELENNPAFRGDSESMASPMGGPLDGMGQVQPEMSAAEEEAMAKADEGAYDQMSTSELIYALGVSPNTELSRQELIDRLRAKQGQ